LFLIIDKSYIKIPGYNYPPSAALVAEKHYLRIVTSPFFIRKVRAGGGVGQSAWGVEQRAKRADVYNISLPTLSP